MQHSQRPFTWNQDRAFKLLMYALAIVYGLIVLLPIYYVVISSFKTNTEIYRYPMLMPQIWTFTKYAIVQERVNIFRAIGISFFITAVSEVLNMMIGFSAAYAIARIPTRLARIAELIFASGYLIPAFAVLVPVYLMAVKTGTLNNPLSLIIFLSMTRLSGTVLLLATFMRELPKEIEESAELDGASRLQVVWKIIFPLSTSGVVTVLILNFLSFWNEYLFALVLLASSDYKTVQMVVPLLRTDKNIDYGLVSAAVVMSVIPIYMIFLAFQERIIRGMLGGAVKG